MIDGVDDAWMVIPFFYLNKVEGIFILKCNYDTNLLDLEGLPDFFINILRSWAKIKDENVPEDVSKIRDQILWNNTNITE